MQSRVFPGEPPSQSECAGVAPVSIHSGYVAFPICLSTNLESDIPFLLRALNYRADLEAYKKRTGRSGDTRLVKLDGDLVDVEGAPLHGN